MLRAAGARCDPEPPAHAALARATARSRSCRRSTRSSASPASSRTRGPAGGTPFVVLLFDLSQGRARRGDRGRPAWASSAPARRAGSRRSTSPSRDARTLGVIGCGWQAETPGRVHPRGAARRSSASSPTAGPRSGCEAFCKKLGAEAGESHRDAGRAGHRRDGHDLAGPGAPRRVAAAGRARLRGRARTRPRRASSTTSCSSAPSFVCCDSIEQAKLESGDLIEPVERGVLDWLEVHELHEVVAGELAGRSSTTTSSSSSRTGSRPGTSRSAPRAIELARESEGREARSRPARSSTAATDVVAERADQLRAGRAGASRSCGVGRLRTYGSSRISPSERPRSCSRMT